MALSDRGKIRKATYVNEKGEVVDRPKTQLEKYRESRKRKTAGSMGVTGEQIASILDEKGYITDTDIDQKSISNRSNLNPGFKSTEAEIKTGTLRSQDGFYSVGGEIAAGKRTAELLAASQRQEAQRNSAYRRYMGYFDQAKARGNRKYLERQEPEQDLGKPIPFLAPNPKTGGTTLIPVIAYSKPVEVTKQYSDYVYTGKGQQLTKSQSSFSDAGYDYLQREKKYNQGMEKIAKQANIITTFGKQTPYEERSFAGKVSQNVVTGLLGLAPFYVKTADKAYITTRGLIQNTKSTWQEFKPTNVLRKEEFWNVFGDVKTVGKTKLFIPFSSPESFTTLLFASSGAFLKTYAKYRTPVKPKVSKSQGPAPSIEYFDISKSYKINGFDRVSLPKTLKPQSHTILNKNVATGKNPVSVDFGKNYVNVNIGKTSYLQATKSTAFSNKVTVFKQTGIPGTKGLLTQKTTVFNAKTGTIFKSFKPVTKTVTIPLFEKTRTDVKIIDQTKSYVYRGNTGQEVVSTKYKIIDTYTAKVGLFKKIKTTQARGIVQTQRADIVATQLLNKKGYEVTVSDKTGLSKSATHIDYTKGKAAILKPGKIKPPKTIFLDRKIGLSNSANGKINIKVDNFNVLETPRFTKTIDTKLTQTPIYKTTRVSYQNPVKIDLSALLRSKKATGSLTSLRTDLKNLVTVNTGPRLTGTPKITSTPSRISYIDSSVFGTTKILPVTYMSQKKKTYSRPSTKESLKIQPIPILKQSQNPIFTQILRPSQIFKIKPITEVKPLFRQERVTKQQQSLRNYNVLDTVFTQAEIPTTPNIFVPSFSTPGRPPPGLPPPFDFDFTGYDIGQPVRRKRGYSRQYNYRPDVSSILLNIKSKGKKTGKFTGLEARPLIDGQIFQGGSLL